MADDADAILFGLGDSGAEVLYAARLHHESTPIVVQRRRTPLAVNADLPPDCEVLPEEASVDGQIDALRRAALTGRRRRMEKTREV